MGEKEGKENYPKAIYSEDIINNTVNDVAIVISFSRDIISDVKEYLIEEKKKLAEFYILDWNQQIHQVL